MNQDMSAGIGAGLMNIGSMFSQMLAKRMDAQWEDDQYEKRAAAALKAEMAKKEALDKYEATQPAGFAPVVQPGPDGKPQYLQQPINKIGAPVGDTQPMPAYARTAYDLAEKAREQKTMLDNLTLQGKMTDIEADKTRMLKDRSATELNNARASGKIGGPRAAKEKEPKGWKSETYAIEKLDTLGSDLHPNLVKEYESRRALLESNLPAEYDEEVYAKALKNIFDDIKKQNDELMRKVRMKKTYGDDADELYAPPPKIGAPK